MSAFIPTRLLDLGFAMARIEAASDDTPMLTIMTPSCDGENASSVVVSGWENLYAFGAALIEYDRDYNPSNKTTKDVAQTVDTDLDLT